MEDVLATSRRDTPWRQGKITNIIILRQTFFSAFLNESELLLRLLRRQAINVDIIVVLMQYLVGTTPQAQ